MKQIKDDSVAKLIRILDEHRREIDKSLLRDPYADNAIALYEKTGQIDRLIAELENADTVIGPTSFTIEDYGETK